MLQRAYDMVSNEIEKAEGPDERMAQSSEEKLLKLLLNRFLPALQDVVIAEC